MQRDQVISILETLSEGQTPLVVEALATATSLLRKDVRPASAGARWTAEEDANLCAEHDAGDSIRDIAARHGRTPSAITIRLVKLGRIDAGAVTSRDRGARVVA